MRRALGLACAAALGACARGGGPIVIGVAAPLERNTGQSMRRAAELAVKEINARGPVWRGRTLSLRVLDDSNDANTAVDVARVLAADPAVVAVAGDVSSAPTIAAAPVYAGAADPLVLVSPSASSPDLSGITPYFFRVCPTDLAHGPALADFAWRALRARRAAVIYENDDYGRGVRREFTKSFRALGGLVLSEDPYVPSTGSLEPYLSRLKALGGVDVLVLAGDPEGAVLALQNMRTLALHWPLIGGDGLTGVEDSARLAEGVRVSLSYLADKPDTVNRRFVAAFRAAWGEPPDDVAASTYDIVHLLARAVAAVGPDRAKIRDYLASVGRGRPAYPGVTGGIAFDSDGDAPAKGVVIGVVHNGRYELERTP